MSKIQNKALNMGDEVKEQKESFFFPDIDGKSITVEADSLEEAEKIAKKISKI